MAQAASGDPHSPAGTVLACALAGHSVFGSQLLLIVTAVQWDFVVVFHQLRTCLII